MTAPGRSATLESLERFPDVGDVEQGLPGVDHGRIVGREHPGPLLRQEPGAQQVVGDAGSRPAATARLVGELPGYVLIEIERRTHR